MLTRRSGGPDLGGPDLGGLEKDKKAMFSRRHVAMPSAERAPKGRSEPIPTAQEHLCLQPSP